MTTHIRAVPSAPVQLPTFRERGLAALETHQGADLVGWLAMLHEQDMSEVVAQAAAARTAVAEVTAAAAIDQQMLAHLLGIIQPVLRASTENSARIAHFTEIIEAVRALANEAEVNDDGRVDVEQLRAVLTVLARPAPWRPLVLGFVPAQTYRVGHFRVTQTETMVHLPFVGYSLCQEMPERPMTTHMSFLREGTVRPRPQLYHEFGLVLEHVE